MIIFEKKCHEFKVKIQMFRKIWFYYQAQNLNYNGPSIFLTLGFPGEHYLCYVCLFGSNWLESKFM